MIFCQKNPPQGDLFLMTFWVLSGGHFLGEFFREFSENFSENFSGNFLGIFYRIFEEIFEKIFKGIFLKDFSPSRVSKDSYIVQRGT
jgi:hypothetical protein